MTIKSDAPALRVIIQQGKLVPATAFDAERIDSYRNGSELSVQVVNQADRKDVRKWWAILGKAVKEASTPWKNSTQASEAIKLALGIVHLGKTVGGQMMQWPKSLNELDDADLADAVRDMKAVLQKITGVDPDTWQREIADVGEDKEESPQGGARTPSGEGGGAAADLQQQSAAPDHSAAADLQEGGASDEAASPSVEQADAKLFARMRECLDKFIGVATDLNVPEAKDRQDNLIFTKNVWKEDLKARPEFVKACTDTMNKVIKGKMEVGEARAYLEALIK